MLKIHHEVIANNYKLKETIIYGKDIIAHSLGR